MRIDRLTLVAFLTLVAAGGCGARSFGGPANDGGGVVPDGAGLVDGGLPPPAYFGYVSVLHLRDQGYASNSEYVALSAAYFGEQYDPFLESVWATELLQTPDGVLCELTYISGMDGPIPQEPPPELDGGEIWAWPGYDGATLLEISFSDGEYGVDHRTPNGPVVWPTWVTEGEFWMELQSTGSAHADPFGAAQSMPALPEIIAPPDSSDEPLTPDPDGTYLIAWTPVAADLVEVTLHFNMDWDDSYFRCYLADNVTQMRLPHAWLEQNSWGSGELMVNAVNEGMVIGPTGAVTHRAIRVRRQQLNVAVW